MILHVDMDAFYASVEERDQPELRGKPVIVGGSAEGRGVVCAANYQARRYGVHSAMPAATAVRLCPHAVFLSPRMDYYASISEHIREVFDRFSPLVEPLSLDEAFLDVTGCERLFGSAAEIARQIKTVVRKETDLVASVGVAPIKFLAKIASDLEKPDGLVVVEPGGVQQFLDPLPIARLWGVGKTAAKSFRRLGIDRVGQLRTLSLELLQENFGSSSGRHLWQLAHGIDERRVVPDHAARSISHETTFANDVENMQALRAWLLELTEQVARRLRRLQLRGRTVQLKIRYGDFSTYTRSHTLAEATSITDDIWTAADGLLTRRLPQRPLAIRLLGVGVSGIEGRGETQPTLFDEQERLRQTRLDTTTDEIQQRFGTAAIKRALGMGKSIRRRSGGGSDPD